MKTRELSPDEWRALLEPFGWADITIRQPAVMFKVTPSFLEYEIRVWLKASPPDSGLGEWAERGYLLEQARQAVEAVRAEGYLLGQPPSIEFGGDYRYRVDDPVPEWVAAAELGFRVSGRA